MDVNKQAWPSGVPMTDDPVIIKIDSNNVSVPAKGVGNMFHRWLAWLPVSRREIAYKLMEKGYSCYGTYKYVMGSKEKPIFREGV